MEQKINSATLSNLRDLTQALKDSAQHLVESANHVRDDDFVSSTLLAVGAEREGFHKELSELIREWDGEPATESSFGGKLRMIWTAMRAALNSGDPVVVLIESENADQALLEQFRFILADTRHIPLTVQLNEIHEKLKKGSHQISTLRNRYECGIR